MKDENIKEILDKLQKVANREIASRNALMEMKDKDYQLLLDYITNLQEEKERLKRDKNMIFDANCNLSKVMNNYKTRIDKAIELLNDWNYLDKIDCYYEPKEVIDILKGSDK